MRSILFLLLLITAQYPAQKWLVAYYMPYDNDLDHSAEFIVKESFNGVKSPNLTVVFQADRMDSTGMKRVVLNSGALDTIEISSEQSSHTESLENYLSWIEKEFEFSKMALIFLNHGGKLDEIGLDEYPAKSWMKIDSLAHVVEEFNQRIGNKIELLHLQVCSKANIEVAYELQNCSKYTMFSQFVLGAPNYYYRNAFQKLSLNPEVSGEQLAMDIATNDSLFMYYSYSCVNNSNWESVNTSLNQYLGEYSTYNLKRVKSKIRNTKYMDQLHWDFVSLINNFSLKRKGRKSARELAESIQKDLITFNLQNPRVPQIKGFSGISILAFTEKDNFENYQNLQFYQDFDFKEYCGAVLNKL